MARVETTRAVVHTIQTVALTRIGAWMHSANIKQSLRLCLFNAASRLSWHILCRSRQATHGHALSGADPTPTAEPGTRLRSKLHRLSSQCMRLSLHGQS